MSITSKLKNIFSIAARVIVVPLGCVAAIVLLTVAPIFLMLAVPCAMVALVAFGGHRSRELDPGSE
jgi:hypothetical protein